MRQSVAILAGAAIAGLATILVLTLAFDSPLPEGAWAGFGIVGAVALGLVAGAVLLARGEPHVHEANAGAAHAVSDEVTSFRVLVIADALLRAEQLSRLVRVRSGDRSAEVLVVSPALNSPLRHWTSDEDRARVDAAARLDAELAQLAEHGIRARGQVGVDDPVQAMDDALRTFPADEVVIATPAVERRNWLERGVVERARQGSAVPVDHVVVEP